MTITVDAVVQEVRKLARENPEFIYTEQVDTPEKVGGSCSYLAGLDEMSFNLLQDDGKFSEDLTYEEARQQGILGQRCIVGQALSNIGVSDVKLREYEGVGADYLLGYLLDVDEVARASQSMWLNSVQSEQDNGVPWGDAVKIADAEFPIG